MERSASLSRISESPLLFLRVCQTPHEQDAGVVGERRLPFPLGLDRYIVAQNGTYIVEIAFIVGHGDQPPVAVSGGKVASGNRCRFRSGQTSKRPKPRRFLPGGRDRWNRFVCLNFGQQTFVEPTASGDLLLRPMLLTPQAPDGAANTKFRVHHHVNIISDTPWRGSLICTFAAPPLIVTVSGPPIDSNCPACSRSTNCCGVGSFGEPIFCQAVNALL